jgi:hypothetical protein
MLQYAAYLESNGSNQHAERYRQQHIIIRDMIDMYNAASSSPGQDFTQTVMARMQQVRHQYR